MKKLYAVVMLTVGLFFSCELYDETAATVNFWDFKNAVVKDWKKDPSSFKAVDFSDIKLVDALIEQYGTSSRFALLSEQEKEKPQLLLGKPGDDYFGYQYYYKYYTEKNPLKSALGTWTGSVLYVAYEAANPIIEMFAGGDMGIDSIFCAFWAEAERENKSSPGKLAVRLDFDGGSTLILDGFAYFYPRMKEGSDIQRVQAANLEGMYMEGFKISFSKTETKGESK